MLKRRPEYFAVFALSAVLAVAAASFTAIALGTGTPALSGIEKQNAAGIVSRASDLAGIDQEEKVAAQMCVRYGKVSTGDYVLSVLTSPEYLLKSADDGQFAKDLCSIVYGSSNDTEIAAITQELSNSNRMAVINDAISKVDSKYAVTGDMRKGAGSVITGFSIDKGLENDDEYIEVDFWFIGYQSEQQARKIIDTLTVMESKILTFDTYQVRVPEDLRRISGVDENPAVYRTGNASLRLYVSRLPSNDMTLTDFVRAQGGSDIETDMEINGIPVASYRLVEAIDGTFHSTLNYVLEGGDGFTTLKFRLDGITAEAEAEEILETLAEYP